MDASVKKTGKKSTFAWILDFAGTHKGSYIASMVLAVLSVACGFLPYVFIARIVKGLLEGSADSSWCIAQCLWIALFWLLNRLFHVFSTATSHKATFIVLGEIRKRLTQKLAKMPLGDVLSRSSGTYKNIITERVDSIETTLAHIVPEVFSNLLVPIGVLIYMLTIDWRLTLLSLISIPVGLIFYSLMLVGSGASYQNTIDKTKILNDTAVEYINGIEVIKAFGKEKTSYEKFVKAAKDGADCFIEWMRRCNVVQGLAMTFLPAQLLTLLPFTGYFYMEGKISGADAMMMIILAMGLVTPFLTISSYVDNMAKMGTIIGEATNILEQPELIRPLKLMSVPVGSSIKLNNVHFAYADEEILHGINLTIKEGTVTALVGPSGAGKSTVAKLIASFWDVKDGSIKYGGVDIRDIPLEEYNKNIAYVSQDNYLFDETVMENIRLGNPKASDEEVMEAAKKCGCHEFIMKLEDGYRTRTGGSGSHLSGGERQRISIARAMLKNAPVVILDEATAYTDPENEAVIQKSVAKLVKGKTLIVIAHRLSTIASADRIVLIDDGRIVAEGTQQELLNTCPMYRSMWEAHMSVKEGEQDA